MKNKRGFTLIELLVVIAILGILAIGLLAAIDPLEQLRKGRDTSKKNTARSFYNGCAQYYASREDFPWIEAGTTGQSSLALDTVTGTWIQSMVDAGEVKEAFAKNRDLDEVFFTSAGVDDLVVCFTPESKAFRGAEETEYNITGGTQAGCPNATMTNCYWCVE